MNNLQMASALAEFVKFCLLNNEEFMRDNETKTISTSDVISQLEEIERNGIGEKFLLFILKIIVYYVINALAVLVLPMKK